MSAMNRRMAALLVFGVVALLSPLVGAFNRLDTVLGLPMLPAYLFGCWGALVAGAWLLTRKGRR